MQNIVSNFESLSEGDITDYAGEWIAIINNKIVAHSKSLREMHEFVKENFPNERPLIGKLPEAIPVTFSV